ncbi:MAG: hypothetical protein V3571_01970 [Pseudodesulfovibrio sp.]
MQAAFAMQLRMAQNLFGEGTSLQGEGRPEAGDDAFVGDSMMYEALTALAQAMRSESLRTPQGPAGADRVSEKLSSLSAANDEATSGADLSGLGALSARFESGAEGVGSIGYDKVGGTSYGTYQIASRPGTMDRFLAFLDGKAPQWAQRLRDAGPANTGSREGGMPAAWKAVADEDPERFGLLQHEFITRETYAPARAMILEQTGLDFDNAPSALREVLWSTSVQHGATGAARIFGRVIDRFLGAEGGGEFNSRLIEGVYDSRMGQFGSSTSRVRRAVANRLENEKQIALNLLDHQPIDRLV